MRAGIEFMNELENLAKGWHLYRLRDAEDRLLYIGCSKNVYSRIYSHEAASSSMLDADVIRRHATRCYVAFASTNRLEALRMEAAAITAERPLLNRHSNYSRWKQVDREFVPIDEETAREVALLRGSDPVKDDAVAQGQRVLHQERMREAMAGFSRWFASAPSP